MIKNLFALGASDIAVIGRDPDKLKKQEKDFLVFRLCILGDVSELSKIRVFSEEITEKRGQLDILIKNAGVVRAGQ